MGKVSSHRTLPPSSESAKVERSGSPVKSSSPLSKDEVRYEPFAWVRGLESGKGRFVESASSLE